MSKYTREAGVRTLERHIAAVCRSVALEVTKQEDDENKAFKVAIDKKKVEEILGVRKSFLNGGQSP